MKPGRNDLPQWVMILRHLKDGKKISQLQALRDFGCMRLASRINELREKGYRIRTDARNQGGKTYAVYRLEDAQDER